MKRKNFIICITKILVSWLLFVFIGMICFEPQIWENRTDSIDQNQLDEYKYMANQLMDINFGKTCKVLIFGQNKKIEFQFSDNKIVTIDYSGYDYSINSTSASFEQIQNSVILAGKILYLRSDKIYNQTYQIELNLSKKFVSIYPTENLKKSISLDFSNENEPAKISTTSSYNYKFLILYIIFGLLLCFTISFWSCITYQKAK